MGSTTHLKFAGEQIRNIYIMCLAVESSGSVYGCSFGDLGCFQIYMPKQYCLVIGIQKWVTPLLEPLNPTCVRYDE